MSPSTSPIRNSSHLDETLIQTPNSHRCRDLPHTPQNRVSSAATSVISPSTLISPCDYHSPGFIDRNLGPNGEPNRKLKRFSKSLEGKSYHSFVLDSAKKDLERIREARMRPDENGIIEVASESNGSIRRWQAHEPNPEGRRRLFPLNSEENDKIIKLEGSEAYELVQSYAKEDGSTFESYLRNSRKRKREND